MWPTKLPKMFAFSGPPPIGFNKFLTLANKINDSLTAHRFAKVIWEEANDIASAAEFESVLQVQEHLQNIVDIYTTGEVYDPDANIISINGTLKHATNTKTKSYMAGSIHSRLLDQFNTCLMNKLYNLDCSQLLHLSVADVSTVRGVNMPAGKPGEQCTVPQLCDIIGARGGKLALNKKDLVSTVKQYYFLKREVSKTYVDRNPNHNVSTYADVDTNSTRSIGTILTDLNAKSSICADAIAFRGLIEDTHRAFYQNCLTSV